MSEPSSLVLSPAEICDITHYRRPKEQLRALAEMGIPAHLRKVDHTVCVLRAHVTNLCAPVAPSKTEPLRKSVRERGDEPQLKSSKRRQGDESKQ